MRNLHSNWRTITAIIVLPLVGTIWTIESLISCYRGESWAAVTIVLILDIWIFLSVRNVHFVFTDGLNVRCWGLRGTIWFQLNNIESVHAYTKGENPNIIIILKAAGEKIRKIEIYPPWGLSGKEFWSIYEFLSKHSKVADHDAETLESARPNQRWLALGLFVAITALILGMFYIS